MIGLPGSTGALDAQTVAWCETAKLDQVFWSIASPYPGTKMYDIVRTDPRYRIVWDWRQSVHNGPAAVATFETDDYSAAERRAMFIRACLRTGAYHNLHNTNDPGLAKALALTITALKHDPQRLPGHLFHMARKLVRSLAARGAGEQAADG